MGKKSVAEGGTRIVSTAAAADSQTARRVVFGAIVAVTMVGMTALMAWTLASGGWSVCKAAILLCFVGVTPWLGVCLGNALAGFIVLVAARDPARYVLPVDVDPQTGPITTRVALAITIRNEPMELVLPPLRALLDELDDPHFALFVLSDTPDGALESAAIAAFDRPLTYRRRTVNTGYKAGNVMDFMDHHADGFDLAVMLDADSVMSAAAIRRLVRIMQAGPQLGIVQHLTVGLPAAAAFPRLFQFGMRAGMRSWAVGQAWWQGDEGPYWGHNAILRIAPFRAHARLAPLPDGSAILSHDQIEAAQIRAAGWGVCVWAGEEGSQEANPPALPEFLGRDSRWLAGNLQYRHLLRAPGFRLIGRWQMIQAILLFAGAPLYTAILALTALSAASGDTISHSRLLALAIIWPVSLYAPKLLAYVEVLIFPARRARYGGAGIFLRGILAETIFTLLLDAITPVSKTLAMLRLLFGAKPGWLPQNRGDRGVSWKEAACLFWPHTVFGLAIFAASPVMLWALPFAGGLLVAIPFCVFTADPGFSAGLKRRKIAMIPEEERGAAPSPARGQAPGPCLPN